ncbi:hypothetical protein WCP94_002298 [Bilophila wadsworthia]
MITAQKREASVEASLFCAGMGRLHRISVSAGQAAGWWLSEAFGVSRWLGMRFPPK